MTNSPYLRLSGKHRTWTGFSQAWLGGDHLLIVNSNRFVERYQRFAFSDIQAIVVSEARGTRGVWQALVVLLCLAAGLSAKSSFGRGFFAVIGLIALVLAVLDVARGPRCRCVLQTAVSGERLSSISRMPTARAFLATMTPAIEAVQGGISVENLMAQPTTMPLTSGTPDPTVQPPVIDRPLGYAPEILFGLLMLDSVLVLVALRSTIGVALGLLPTVYFAEFLIGIFALVQSRTRAVVSLAVLIAAFACVLIDPFALSGTAVWPSLTATFRMARSGPPQWNLGIDASTTTLLLSVGWRAAIAVTGLVVCHFERTRAAD